MYISYVIYIRRPALFCRREPAQNLQLSQDGSLVETIHSNIISYVQVGTGHLTIRIQGDAWSHGKGN